MKMIHKRRGVYGAGSARLARAIRCFPHIHSLPAVRPANGYVFHIRSSGS